MLWMLNDLSNDVIQHIYAILVYTASTHTFAVYSTFSTRSDLHAAQCPVITTLSVKRNVRADRRARVPVTVAVFHLGYWTCH
ncbi:hypothetical protein BDW22DRAFT_234641 [Trametopsis cervina]|nr:hypothetical protein BDW22DRAFT_234641 [Trametopsis cervina]